MKLLPAILSIIALFLIGSLFLHARRASGKNRVFLGFPVVILLLAAGLSLIVFGKIAILLTLVALVVLLISSRLR